MSDCLSHVNARPIQTRCDATCAGVLVIDRVNGVVYVDISERADRGLAEEWTQRMGYKNLVAFRCGGRSTGSSFQAPKGGRYF